MFTALLDTCILWPSLQRDFLLSLGVEGAFRPIWSHTILEELEYEESRKLISRGFSPGDAALRARLLIKRMEASFSDSIVEGWEPLVGTYGLPDPNDEHVLAAAVMGGAGAIVTLNLRHFPLGVVPSQVQVLTPAEFLADNVSLHPDLARLALHEIATRRASKRAHVSPYEIAQVLARKYSLEKAMGYLLPDL
jgi:predicted nucleic acid-binding protein